MRTGAREMAFSLKAIAEAGGAPSAAMMSLTDASAGKNNNKILLQLGVKR